MGRNSSFSADDLAGRESCTNCGSMIGKLEQPALWRENVVCASCYHRLTASPAARHSQSDDGWARVWTVHDQGLQFGPHTENEIASLVAAGTIAITALVWREGSPRWIPVSNIVPVPAHRPGVPAAPPVVVNVNNVNTNLAASPVRSSGSGAGLMVSGYVCAFVSLIFCPPGFGVAGFVIGIVNLSRGVVGHGIAQIVLSVGCMIVGMAWGAAIAGW
jgi:hypothetical protein